MNTFQKSRWALIALTTLMLYCGGCQAPAPYLANPQALKAHNDEARRRQAIKKALDNGPIGLVVHGYIKALDFPESEDLASFISKDGISGENLAQTFAKQLHNRNSLISCYWLSMQTINEAEKKASIVAKLTISRNGMFFNTPEMAGPRATLPKDSQLADNHSFYTVVVERALPGGVGGENTDWRTVTARAFYLVLEDGAWKINKVGPCAFVNGKLVAPDSFQ
jgi:hypothetical protein